MTAGFDPKRLAKLERAYGKLLAAQDDAQHGPPSPAERTRRTAHERLIDLKACPMGTKAHLRALDRLERAIRDLIAALAKP